MTIHKFITNTRRADVSFCDNGRIDLTSRVVRALDIKPGDVIGIMSAAGETYLYVAHRADTLVGRHEGQCHPTRKGSRHFRAWSRRLTSALLEQCGGVKRADLAFGQMEIISGYQALTLITKNIIPHD